MSITFPFIGIVILGALGAGQNPFWAVLGLVNAVALVAVAAFVYLFDRFLAAGWSRVWATTFERWFGRKKRVKAGIYHEVRYGANGEEKVANGACLTIPPKHSAPSVLDWRGERYYLPIAQVFHEHEKIARGNIDCGAIGENGTWEWRLTENPPTIEMFNRLELQLEFRNGRQVVFLFKKC